MNVRTPDRLQGSLSLLILKSLASRGSMHGYGITVHIHTVAGDVLRVEEGSLYPALHRLTQDGLLRAEWKTSENNRRARYYSLTAAGRKRLAEEEQRFLEVSDAVRRVLMYV